MSSSRLVKAMLEYGVNESSIRRVVDSTRRVDSALRDVQRTAGRTGASSLEATQGFARMASAQDRAAASGKKLTQVLNDNQRAAQRLNAEMQRGASGGGRGAGTGSLTGRGGSLATFGRELRALPAVMIPGAGFSSDVVGKVINTIGNTGVSLTQLGAAAGILAPAVIAGAVALDRFNKEIEQYKSRLDAAIRAQRTLSEARAELTETEAREALATATRNRDRLQQDAQRAREAADRAFADAQANFSDPIARLLDSQTGVAQLREEAEELTAQYQEQADLVTGYTNDLEANAYATATAAEAERRLTEDRLRNAQIGLSAALQSRQEARTLTGTGARTLLEDLKLEYNEIIRLGIPTEQASQRLAELSQHMLQLENNTIPAIDAREREEQAIEGLTDALEEQAKAEEKLGDIKADILEAEADNVAKLAQIASDLTAKISEAEHDRDAALAEIDRDAGLAREDAVRESNEALEDAEVDHQERLAKIQSDYNKDFENAVGERDALSAYKAQQARTEQAEEEQKDYDKRRKEINKRLSDTNKDIDRKLAEQSRTVRMRYEEQLRTAQIAAQRAVDLENARARAQIATLQNSYTIQAQLVADWANKAIGYTLAVQQAGAALLAGLTKSAPKQYSTGTSGVGTKYSTGSSAFTLSQQPGYLSTGVFAYASGGDPPVGRRVLVGENGPEIAEFKSPVHIYSNSETKRMSGGGGASFPITINGNNLSRREVVGIAAGELNSTLKAAGWK